MGRTSSSGGMADVIQATFHLWAPTYSLYVIFWSKQTILQSNKCYVNHYLTEASKTEKLNELHKRKLFRKLSKLR